MVVILYLVLFSMIIAVACAFLCASMAKKKGYGYLPFFFIGLITGVIGLIITTLMKDKDLRDNGTADNLMKYSYLFQLGVISLDEFMWRKNKLVENTQRRKDEEQGIRMASVIFAVLSSLLATLQIVFFLVSVGSINELFYVMSQAHRVEGGTSFVFVVVALFVICVMCVVTAVVALIGSRKGNDTCRKIAFYLSLFNIGLLFILVFFQFAYADTTYFDTIYVVISVACAFISAKFLYDLPQEEVYISELAYPQFSAGMPSPMMPMMPFGGSGQQVILLQQPPNNYGSNGNQSTLGPAAGMPPQG